MSQTFTPGTSQQRIHWEGTERIYTINFPSRSSLPLPLVIALHGTGGSGLTALGQGRWIEKSNLAGFVVAGLNGTLRNPEAPPHPFRNPRVWNNGEWDGVENNPIARVDDVGLIRAIIKGLVDAGLVAADQVYITGFSNGAGMAFRAGVELSAWVRAIAPVANGLLIEPDHLANPVSALMIWGKADPINPYQGGVVRRYGHYLRRPAAEASWRRWGELLHCSPGERLVYDRPPVVAKSLEFGQAKSLLYAIDGMGHCWPGGQGFMPERIVGPAYSALDATDLIWRFFRGEVPGPGG